MAIITERRFVPLTDTADPDDWRPNSRIAAIVDPARPDGAFVRGLVVLWEVLAPGDRIPLHRHTMEEILIIDEGVAEVRLGDETQTVRSGAVVFVPAGIAHGTRNLSGSPVTLHAIFPFPVIDIEYLERNPAPGTEGDPPRPPFSVDVRGWAEQTGGAGGA